VLLILVSVPEALSAILAEALLHGFAAQAFVDLLRGDVVDVGMVVLVVIPVKESFEIGHGFGVIQNVAGVSHRDMFRLSANPLPRNLHFFWEFMRATRHLKIPDLYMPAFGRL